MITRNPLLQALRHQTFAFRGLLFSLMVSTTSAFAGVEIVWSNEVVGQPTTNQLTVRYQGQRCLLQYAPSFSVLLDGESGTGYQLLHPPKMFVRKPLGELVKTNACGGATNPVPPVATGRSMVVEGRSCAEYQMVSECGESRLWVTPDFPNFKQIQKEGAALSGLARLMGMQFADANLPGMIVRSMSMATVPDTNATPGAVLLQTNIMTLLSASVVPDDPELMRVPSDYREVTDFATALNAATNRWDAWRENREALARHLTNGVSASVNPERQTWLQPAGKRATNVVEGVLTGTNSVYFGISSWEDGREVTHRKAITLTPKAQTPTRQAASYFDMPSAPSTVVAMPITNSSNSTQATSGSVSNQPSMLTIPAVNFQKPK